MANFTDQDKKTLDILAKGFRRWVDTSSTKSPWQEFLDRQESLYTAKSSVAADVIRGFAGSWAASYALPMLAQTEASGASLYEPTTKPDLPSVPPASQRFTGRLGQRGMPEINFPPFQVFTNSFGPKGPSLLGHPISIDIQGPTLRSEFCDWIWKVTQGGGDFGGDLLEMDVRYDGGAAASATVLQGYNVADFTIGGLTEPNGGLYLVIVEDGSAPGALPGALLPMPALATYADSARFEIFRIVSARNNRFTLHPNKPLSRFFDLPLAAVRYIRAVMVFRPFVTRLAAIPSGLPGQTTANPPGLAGREQIFAVVTPEVCAGSDLFPPYDGPGAGFGVWLLGGFTEKTAPGSFGAAGDPAAYLGRFEQPVPIPTGPRISAIVEKGAAVLPSSAIGTWTISVTDTTPFTTGATPKIVKVFRTRRQDDSPGLEWGGVETCLGWFQVASVNVGVGTVTLFREPEIDWIRGQVFYGPGPYVQSASLTEDVFVDLVIYDPIRSLWSGAFDFDKVQASRLTTLIDPSWVERTEKHISNLSAHPVIGRSSARSDRAIFDTRTGFGAPILEAADPGNLGDLGFRMVIFPAKESSGGFAIPDFSRPISSREVTIDPSISESQTIDVDYAAGIVRLSHAPPLLANVALGQGDIVPNGIVGLTTNNPRGEVVLFAACVPYSMESGQRSPGVAVANVGTQLIEAKIDTANTNILAIPPFFGPSILPPNDIEIILDRIWDGPMTGCVEILSGSLNAPSFGVWAYTTVNTRNNGFAAVSALGGLSCLSTATTPLPGSGETRTVVLRRDVDFAESSVGYGQSWFDDVSYSSSKRVSQLDFPRASLRPTLSGSVQVEPGPAWSTLGRQWGMIVPSKMKVGVGFPTNPTPFGNYFGESGLFMGLQYQVPFGHPNAPAPGGNFWCDPAGSFIELVADALTPSWHGVITDIINPLAPVGILSMLNNFRLEIRFGVEYPLIGEICNFFGGFVQFAGIPPATPSVNEITQGPAVLAADYRVLGMWHDSTVSPNLTVWSRGTGGDLITPFPVLVDSGTTTLHGPFTFVIEVGRAPMSIQLGASSIQVQAAVYDSNQVLIQRMDLTNTDFLPLHGTGLHFCLGIRKTGVNNVKMRVFHASLITNVSDRDLTPLLPMGV